MFTDPQVRRVVLARFVSRVGGEAAFFVGIWGKAAFVLDATASQLAVVMAALGVASLIGTSVAGVLIDRFDPRRVVMVGEAVFIPVALAMVVADRSEEHTSELQSRPHLVCRLLLEKKKTINSDS